MHKALAILFALSLPFSAYANMRITEIMYNLSGTDTGREWVEIHNDGASSVDLTGWKWNDGSNHLLYAPPQKGGVGSIVVSSGAYAILAASSTQFISEHSAISVSVINTSMDLGQQDNRTYTLALMHPDDSPEDTISYTTTFGANGDGDSLQLIDGVWKAASSTPGVSFSSGNGGAVSGGNAGTNQNVSPQQTSSVAASGDSGVWVADAASISAYAGKDREVIVGADTAFEGKAIGIAGKPLENARFVWSFGDGGRAEGESVLHAFTYPGMYSVVLDVSSGKYAASHRIKVIATLADISISRVASGVDSFIELHNKTSRELDLSWWRLKSGSVYFTFPKNTFLLPNAKIVFPFRITKLPIVDARDVTFLYPNGEVAAVYTKDEEAVPALPSAVSKLQAVSALPISEKSQSVAFNKGFLKKSAEAMTGGKEASSSLAATFAAVQELPKTRHASQLWLWGVFAIALLSLVGVFVGRKKDDGELTADDIEIVE